MPDIELVIRIPEDEYRNVLATGKASFRAVNAIESGTPLPKGHGRLIDADAVKKKYPLMENDFGMTFNEGIHRAIDSMPTII